MESNSQEKIYVVIDSSVLVAEFSSNKASFITLSRLSSKDLISIVIPQTVKKEFISRRRTSLLENLNDIGKNIESLLRKQPVGNFSSPILAAKKSLMEAHDYLEINSSYLFDTWCRNSKCIILDLDLDIFSRAFDAYFNGFVPFPKAKSRDDIPDSVIYYEIAKLSSEGRRIFFLCGDRNLGEKVRDNLNIKCFQNVDELINDKAIINIIDFEISSQTERDNSRLIIESLFRSPSLLQSQTNFILDQALNDMLNYESLFKDSDKKYIEPSDITFPLTNIADAKIVYLGDGEFSIECRGIISFNIYEVIYRGDYDDLSEAERLKIEITGYVDDYLLYDLEIERIEFDTNLSFQVQHDDLLSVIRSDELAIILIRGEFSLEGLILVDENYLY